MDILEDLNRVKWNFVTLIIGLVSFINLKIRASEFVKEYGNKVNIKNLLIDGYTTGTLKIIMLMLLTIAILALTIYISYTYGPSLFGTLQIIVSIFLIIWSLVLAWAPFIGTIILIAVIGAFLVFIINN